MTNGGLVYVFTGEGKGKTSAALGVATRSLLLGEKVVWVAFYKQESWGLAEAKLKDKFPNLEMNFVGKGFRIGKKTAPVGDKGHVVVDTASEAEHVLAAEEGLQLTENSLQQKPFLLVMDEVLNAVSEGLLEEEGVLQVLAQRGKTHMVLTGRGRPFGSLPKGLMAVVDLVTECKKIKHPYDMGKLAVRGLDF
jgi:cob(I)alamin adenosyltransferase